MFFFANTQELQKSAQMAMGRPQQPHAVAAPTSEQILAVENGLKQVLFCTIQYIPISTYVQPDK